MPFSSNRKRLALLIFILIDDPAFLSYNQHLCGIKITSSYGSLVAIGFIPALLSSEFRKMLNQDFSKE